MGNNRAERDTQADTGLDVGNHDTAWDGPILNPGTDDYDEGDDIIAADYNTFKQFMRFFGVCKDYTDSEEGQDWGKDLIPKEVHWACGVSWLADLIARLAANTVMHDHLRACRIGEASHPGPAGARKTCRKRKQREEASNNEANGGGLEQMIRDIITKVLKEMLQGQLSGYLKSAISSALGSNGPARREQASQDSDDEPPPKTPRTANGGKAAGKGEKGKSNGKATSTESAAAPNDKDKDKDNDKNKKGKGKGKDKTDKPKPSEEKPRDLDVPMTWAEKARQAQKDKAGFVQIRPALRATDWNGPVLTVENIVRHDITKPLRRIIDVEGDEVPYVTALLQAITADYGVTLVERRKKKHGENGIQMPKWHQDHQRDDNGNAAGHHTEGPTSDGKTEQVASETTTGHVCHAHHLRKTLHGRRRVARCAQAAQSYGRCVAREVEH
jgi:hypothetical protein